MYYIKNSIEIIKSGNNDPDLMLMANLTVNSRLKIVEPYINECIKKRIKPIKELLKEYTELNAIRTHK